MLILLLFLVPPGFLQGSWMQVSGGDVTGADIAGWPYSVGVALQFCGFFGDPCIGPQMLVTWVILGFPTWRCSSFLSWLGHRLLGEKVTRMHFAC